MFWYTDTLIRSLLEVHRTSETEPLQESFKICVPLFPLCDLLALFRCDPVERSPIQDGMWSVVV
jgi:hypothetical protein